MYALSGAGHTIRLDDVEWVSVGESPAPDPVDMTSLGDTLFAATLRNGIQRSLDGGATWSRVGDTLGDYGATRIAADRGELWMTATHGVYRSSDGGERWENVTPRAMPIGATARAILFVEDAIVIAASGEIWITRNRGRHWSTASEGLNGVHLVELGLAGDTVLTGTEGNGVYRRPLADLLSTGSVRPARRFDIDRLDLSIRTR